MSKIKVIKTEEDYVEAIKMMEEIMISDPDPDSEDGEKLGLLATLIQDYETKTVPMSLPDPVDAILFRMEQQGLKSTDLIQYMGSSSRVSEVLSRKRPLSLSMIRALETGLDIPAKVLLTKPDEFRNVDNIAWDRFPIKEMGKRGYFEGISAVSDFKEMMEKFFLPIGSPSQFFGMLRKTNYRSTRMMNKQSLAVWSAMVIKKANSNKPNVSYKSGNINLEFMQEIARLSAKNNGPILAQDLLKDHGVNLVIEPHFAGTYLDGCAILINKKNPIIGLTLRYDRLDNFWFTLMHELAHISLHSDNDSNLFYDDLDNPDINNSQEKEADQLAGEALIPQTKWENSPARLVPTPIAAESLARELGVHRAIVAGRMRHEGNKYVYLSNITKQAKIRISFPEEKWIK